MLLSGETTAAVSHFSVRQASFLDNVGQEEPRHYKKQFFLWTMFSSSVRLRAFRILIQSVVNDAAKQFPDEGANTVSARRVILIAITTCLASHSLANAEGWSFKSLLPGRNNDIPPVQEESEFPNPFKAASNGLKKVNNGTKAMLAKTKDIMPDWMFPETRANISRSSNEVQSSFGKIKQEVRTAQRAVVSPFKKLAELAQPEPDPGPQTVTDFLKQERPKY